MSDPNVVTPTIDANNVPRPLTGLLSKNTLKNYFNFSLKSLGVPRSGSIFFPRATN